jgi:hypothetical protein
MLLLQGDDVSQSKGEKNIVGRNRHRPAGLAALPLPARRAPGGPRYADKKVLRGARVYASAYPRAA